MSEETLRFILRDTGSTLCWIVFWWSLFRAIGICNKSDGGDK